LHVLKEAVGQVGVIRLNDFSGQSKAVVQPWVLEWWESKYRKWFPRFVSMERYDNDNAMQSLGVDCVIKRLGGIDFRIDEKVRWKPRDKNGKVLPCNWYGKDILLEYIANDNKQSPGWIAKPLKISHIAYGFIDIDKAYLLPWYLLQLVWEQHSAMFKNSYEHITASNTSGGNNYRTLSIAVPIGVLFELLEKATNTLEKP